MYTCCVRCNVLHNRTLSRFLGWNGNRNSSFQSAPDLSAQCPAGGTPDCNYSEGYSKGFSQRYSQRYSAGYSEGYSEGYSQPAWI